jgi:ankyrin repeat protein
LDPRCDELRLAAEKGELERAKALLNQSPPPHVDSKDHKGRTALMLAASSGQEQAPLMMELLISRGANANATDMRGSTALMAAAAGGHRKVVELLLGHPDINVMARDADKNSALDRATDEEIQELLLRFKPPS